MRNLLSRLLLILLPFAAGCEPRDSLDHVLDSGRLTVVSRNSPTTWYIDKQGDTGFEYALAQRLADRLGVELNIVPAYSLDEIFVKLDRGDADLAAAGLALTGDWESRYPHSVPYYQLRPQVIYMAGNYRPREVADLRNMSIAVLAGSNHSGYLQALKQGGFPEISWREVAEVDSMELLELVDAGEVELAIVDSNEFTVQQRLYPRLKVAFDLGSSQDMVWYLPPDRDNTRLLAVINEFLGELQADGTIAAIRDAQFGHSRIISRIGSHTFTLNMQRVLPRYEDLIRKVAAEYQMDWHLLAAIAYQESHWNPRAQSPTGVRGMMMLTLPTAREMGVTNRTDPGQSLRGGARYFKQIKRRLPDDIYEPDRTYMALAAYNIGRGHLEDARVLTERRGGDPHLWSDVMEALPLLQNSKYYQTVKRGYARGNEAVTYVQNIRHYLGILEWQDIAQRQPIAPIQPQALLPRSMRGLELKAL
ncbi:membrane-bound lytic murein transglycosylase MltF [Pseudohalioglobus sediminis]|uniref:Membrane-bound lytic murein transglycosylase F n=1 Tax=Pseudohalioglobus sediminis TaxID=2606449 RepID=A0A5B0X4S1_9GAMM|nr:membrane-bound lytic murein transglycosylase MltF [Pseudohalioglobus sediminis]KAA1194400.1 membrane-bound lytic murein transglycosylase MltF [Pseudohalioglobus sediminis]